MTEVGIAGAFGAMHVKVPTNVPASIGTDSCDGVREERRCPIRFAFDIHAGTFGSQGPTSREHSPRAIHD